MTKKHFIALADVIKVYRNADNYNYNSDAAVEEFSNILADFLQSQNSRFNPQRWLAYIAGECGSNGGAVKR